MADEKDIAADAPAPGGRRRLIIIAAAALLLLVGIGVALLLLVGDDATDQDGEAVVPVEVGDPQYLKLDPVFVVSLAPTGQFKLLQVAIEVMTRTPGVLDTLRANNPMIRHHVINLLETRSSADLLSLQGKQQLQEDIHQMLNDRLKELGQPGEIRGVYFTQFVMQ